MRESLLCSLLLSQDVGGQLFKVRFSGAVGPVRPAEPHADVNGTGRVGLHWQGIHGSSAEGPRSAQQPATRGDKCGGRSATWIAAENLRQWAHA